jgi:hypothetical protein
MLNVAQTAPPVKPHLPIVSDFESCRILYSPFPSELTHLPAGGQDRSAGLFCR